MSKPISPSLSGWARKGGALLLGLAMPLAGHALTLGDVPTAYTPPPANVLLTPSVEYPTPATAAHQDDSYDSAKTYLGYFDPDKCYDYSWSWPQGYFYPVAMARANHKCQSFFSGNALNYATMGAIDTFRWALTGGYRSVDDPAIDEDNHGTTILVRSYQTKNNIANNLKNKRIPNRYGSLVLADSVGYGTKVKIDGVLYEARVQVCVPEFLESNCAAYTDYTASGKKLVTYKPEGLIQKYQGKLRLGVFSYLLNQGVSLPNGTGYENDLIPGAVLRARLGNIAPYNEDGTDNPNREWNPKTGQFIENPAPADARKSGVSRSGVINYLNGFGYLYREYQKLDHPSDMYAEALRYLMNKSPTGIYTAAASRAPQSKENFPVITNWDDPIISGCQKNAIVGIGDVHTHRESYMGTLPMDATTWMKKMDGETLTPSDIKRTINMKTELMCWGTRENDKRFLPPVPIGTPTGAAIINPPSYRGTIPTNPPYCTDGGSNKIAALAYYAHTQNIRPDKTKGTGNRVTVDTYWMDVMQKGDARDYYSGSPYPGYVHKNQYWLAAKYGGFQDEVKDGGDFNPAVDKWHSKRRYYRDDKRFPMPDNYYSGGSPDDMVAGLEEIFSELTASDITAAGAGVGWSTDGKGDATNFYKALYYTKDWHGGLEWHAFSGFDSRGVAQTSKVWDAAERIDHQQWNTGRYIVTGSTRTDGSFVAVPFRFINLSAAQKAALGMDEESQRGVLEHLRGKRDGEGGKYRKRGSVLGDIVHSTPVRVQAPAGLYDDTHNPGYSGFKKRHQSRQEMVYVGANDGMLHAIRGGAGGGTEQWAYIPSMLFQGPDGNPKISGLQALSRPNYSHRYYVDAPPVVADVDFARTGGKLSGFGDGEKTKPDWRTVLVSGLGKGGKGFFALDVTKPDVGSESTAAEKVLWEFTDPDMGFSYGRPLITKTRAWGWVVILTSGYNNTSDKTNPNAGKGLLYVLNIKTGELLQKVNTDAGTIDKEAGLAQVSGYTPSYVDYLTDYVYGGDLLGNLWRFDFTSESDTKPALVQLATLANEKGKAQPVTSPPLIEFVKNPGNTSQTLRWVLIGTGQWLSTEDINQGPGAQTQTMYAIRDGDRFTAGTKDKIKRSDLKEVSSLTAGLGKVPDNGWYYDLTGRLDGGMERITFSPVIVGETVGWVGIMPQNVDNSAKCEADVIQGVSRFYAVDLATAKSQVKSGSSTSEYYQTENLLFSLDVVQGKDGFTLAGTTVDGKVVSPVADPLGADAAGGRPSRRGVTNWFTIE